MLAELSISSSSTCISPQDIAGPCLASMFEQGQRVALEGSREATVVRVSKITVQAASQPVSDLIRVTTPLPGARIESPLTIRGEARGTWYFEASFPITLIDANGRVLGSVAAQAQEDWMTTAFVPFVAKLPFSLPSTTTGSLVFEKDNPSGLPEYAAELRVPVRLATQETSVQLYYYDPAKDTDEAGNVLCSRRGLVAVPRRIIKTATPIQDAINELLKGKLTPQEKASGVTTEFPLPGVSLKGANLKNGVLTLEFTDLQNKTGGGSCRVGILWFQIEATAKQFAGVESVLFKPDELFQP